MKTIKHFIRVTIKDIVFWVILPWVYRRAAKHPIDSQKVLFIENRESSLPDSFGVMWDYLEQQDSYQLEFYSLGHKHLNRFQVLKRNIECVRKLAISHYVFLSDASNLVSCVPLRPETKVAQLWHGCGAFKKWGMSTADLLFGGTASDICRHPYYGNLSLVTVSSPEVAWAYRQAMVLEDTPDVVKATGVSRTDVFFDKDWLAQARRAIDGAVSAIKGKQIILYAPTFRGRVAQAEGPDKLDIAAMKHALGDRYVLLIKHHPFVKQRPDIPCDCEDFAIDVSDSLPIDQLLAVSDICISDYSSLVFEYSLFERPMIFFAYDKNDYDDWRGFYYDYDQLTPGPVVTTTEQIIDYIDNLQSRFDVEQVAAFRRKFMSSCDGNATKRIFELLG